MRRVIGGNDVDGPVGDPTQHRVAIGGLAQRRVHLHVRVVGNRRAERFIRQREVMRRHLAGDAHAGFLALADTANRCARAHMGDMEPRPGELSQQNAAFDPQRLCRAGNTAQSE